MTTQVIRACVPAGIRPPLPPILPCPATIAAGIRGLAGIRASTGSLGFGSLVVRAAVGEQDGRRWRDLKRADIATLGNLCVDIVLNVPILPPATREERRAYMELLSASPPDKVGSLTMRCPEVFTTCQLLLMPFFVALEEKGYIFV
ncbi:hypothetical protein KSP40_PGU003228 [Platanthera guangdongensis]|uniref:Uncharacterized protein n=1 Tax=Platanthera guangdongensis TaxID=2320717 RepID=A0ABR2LK09_9ASPA